MSLINDALNRAQAEAAERESAARGGQPPAVGPPMPPPIRSRLPVVLFVGFVALVLIGLVARRWTAVDDAEPTTDPSVASAPAFESPGASAAGPTPEVSATRAASPADQGPGGDDQRGRGPSAATTEPTPIDPTPVTATAITAEAPAAQEPAAVSSPPAPAGAAPAVSAERASTGSAPAGEPATRATTAPTTPPGSIVSEPAVAPETAAGGREPAASEVTAAPAAAVTEPATLPSAAPTTDRAAAGGAAAETWYYVGEVALPDGAEIVLDGIVWSETAPSAMLNGALLGVGSDILGLRIVSIAPRTVTLEGRGQRIALQLRNRRD